MAAASDHGDGTRRPPRRGPALLALAAILAAILTGCTLGRQPQARSAPAPQLASGAQAATTGAIPQVVQRVEPSVVTTIGFLDWLGR